MRKLHTVFRSSYTNYTFPPLVHDGSLLSTSWPILFISHLFIIAILTSIWWCFIAVFIYICLMISVVEPLFVSLWIICMFLEKCLFRSYIFFFKSNCLVLHCMRSLYSFDIDPLWDIWFTNIFSHLIDYLLILLMVPFAVWKHFCLM